MIPKKIRSIVNCYFTLLTQKKMAAGGRALNEIKQRVHSTQWQKGYINALEGMLVAIKSKDDESLLINKVNVNLRQLSRKFLTESWNELLTDFDLGFFAAWIDYSRYFRKVSQLKISGF